MYILKLTLIDNIIKLLEQDPISYKNMSHIKKKITT
jgi:hypothetical protein